MNLASSPSEIEEVWRRGVTDMNPKEPKTVEEMRPNARHLSDFAVMSHGYCKEAAEPSA
jgi:hypothetical protein